MPDELTDANRLLALSSPALKGGGNEDGSDVLLVNSFSATESLSRMFRFDLDVMAELSKADQVSPQKLIGQGVNVRLQLSGGGSRFFHGIVNQFIDVDQTKDFRFYQIQVVPWLWLLTLNSDCRIFQKLTVPDILKQVFKPFGPVRDNLHRTYTQWDYRVQYRETHFNFVSRLMEQEGIFYFFEHEKDSHTLVLADTAEGLPFGTFEKQVEFRPSTTFGEKDEIVFSWQRSQQLDPGMFTLRDYHFELPDKKLEGTEFGLFSVGGNDKFEVYDYPGGYAAKFNDNTPDRLSALESSEPGEVSQRRMEEEESPHETFTGESNCTGLQVGFRFDLQDHPIMSGSYLVKSLQHSATQSHVSGQTVGAQYSNSMTCMPFGRVFRPNRISLRPVVQGPQTALVVGKANEEILTDQFGRIKVQFPWDRLGKKNEQSSCWLRVAQLWSGTKWGAIFIPRIGQEVLVDFLEGDPDQPIVIGSLYNTNDMPPYKLPDNQTQSGIKSRSSKGGDAKTYNEIRFEDKKGSEHLLIHAEKLKMETVEADSVETVGHDRLLIVENDQKEWIKGEKDLHVVKDHKEKIEGAMSIHVLGDQMQKVEGDQSNHVLGNLNEQIEQSASLDIGMNLAEKVGMNQSMDVGMNLYLKAGMNLVLEAGMAITLKASGGFITIGPGGIFISGQPLVMINSGGAAVPGSAGSLTAPKDPVDPTDPGKSDDPYK
jgi:type VI secretion system secreted protein VgrG